MFVTHRRTQAHHVRLAGGKALTAALVILGTLAGAYGASATAADGKPFQAIATTECNSGGIGNGSCEALFPAVPTGFRLEVRHVSCLFRKGGTAAMTAIASRKSGANQTGLHFLQGNTQLSGAVRDFTISQAIFMVINQKERLHIRFSSFDAGGIADHRGCLVSGYLVKTQ